jgi:hypothetical protein
MVAATGILGFVGLFASPALADSNEQFASMLTSDQRWHMEQAGLKPRYRVLPRGHRRVVREGRVYYRIRGHYYRRRGDHWELFKAPEGGLRSVENLAAYPDMPGLSVAPRPDLSDAEVINDKAQCHYTALEQSGYDPTVQGAGVEKSQYQSLKVQYRNSILQCLSARGYQAN